jgi:hypothetical protein
VSAATIITSLHLTAAGITDAALVAALNGLTVAAAADLFQTIYQLALASGAIARKGVVRYDLQGQMTIFDASQIESVMRLLATMRSNGRGGLMIPVAFS